MSGQENVTWLTQDAYDKLQAELEYLSGDGRIEIAKKIDAARQEGDLKENGGYHAARDEQGKREARIRQLEHLLRHAEVGEAPADDGVVEPGMIITAVIAGEESTFLLGNREIAGTTDINVFSEQSPLGIAINGLSVGDNTSYQGPTGRTIKVDIKDAKPFAG